MPGKEPQTSKTSRRKHVRKRIHRTLIAAANYVEREGEKWEGRRQRWNEIFHFEPFIILELAFEQHNSCQKLDYSFFTDKRE